MTLRRMSDWTKINLSFGNYVLRLGEFGVRRKPGVATWQAERNGEVICYGLKSEAEAIRYVEGIRGTN